MKWWLILIYIYAIVRTGMYIQKWYKNKKNKNSTEK